MHKRLIGNGTSDVKQEIVIDCAFAEEEITACHLRIASLEASIAALRADHAAREAELKHEIELRVEQGKALNQDKENFKKQVAELLAENEALREQVRRVIAPLTRQEEDVFFYRHDWGPLRVRKDAFNQVIAARLAAIEQEVPSGK
jgi:chromosome segregation ATPase